MASTMSRIAEQPNVIQKKERTRPLFVRHVPEDLWLKLHLRALERRLSLQEYVIRQLSLSIKQPE